MSSPYILLCYTVSIVYHDLLWEQCQHIHLQTRLNPKDRLCGIPKEYSLCSPMQVLVTAEKENGCTNRMEQFEMSWNSSLERGW